MAQLWDAITAPGSASRSHIILMIAVLLLGFLLRFWHLGTLTDGMLYDEAYKGLDAISIREFGDRPVFLDWNGGREALVGYAVALMQTVFGTSIISVRIVSALAGSFTLVFFYFLSATLFNRNIALVSTFLMAVSKYAMIHSRIGVRAGQFTMFEVASLMCLAIGLYATRRNAFWLLAAGIFAGLGFHSYLAFRIFPVIVVAFFLSRERLLLLRKHWKACAAAFVLCLCIVAPLAKFYLEHLDSMTDRMKRTAVWNQRGKKAEASPAELLMDATWKTMGMFNFKGDRIERHNYREEPMLSPFVGPFFLAGLILVILCARKRIAFFILLYLILTLLPGFLSVDAPNTARVAGCIPPAMLLAGIGIMMIVQGIMRFSRHAAVALLASVLSGAAITGIQDALVYYPARLDALSPEVAEIWGLDRDPANVASLMNRLGPRITMFATPQFFFHSTAEYLTYSKSEHFLFAPGVKIAGRTPPGNVPVVFVQPSVMNLWYLRDDDGKRFYKWWTQYRGMQSSWVRAIVRASYGSHPQLMKGSDAKLLDLLRLQYPQGRLLNFGQFGIFICK